MAQGIDGLFRQTGPWRRQPRSDEIVAIDAGRSDCCGETEFGNAGESRAQWDDKVKSGADRQDKHGKAEGGADERVSDQSWE